MKTGNETALLPAYGRRRILEMAEAYRELAQSYKKSSEKISKRNGEIADVNDRRARLFQKGNVTQHLLMAKNLQDMAETMQLLANENITYHTPSRKKTAMIANGLKKHGIFLHDMYLMEKRSSLQLVLTMHAGRDADFTTEDIADVLSGFFRRSFVSAKENLFFVSYEPEVYIYEMSPPYLIRTGVATAMKEGEKASGDNSFFYEVSGSERICAISDGAGSGEEACADSEEVLDWLERYVDSGFLPERAAEIVNGYFMSLGREQNMPTLDLCKVDLANATVSFVKYGAPFSYIKRGKSVEKIPGGGYPLGFYSIEENEGIREYDMFEGDSVVMISDGVLECFAKEELFEEAVRCMKSEDASEAANYLMQCALMSGNGRIRDDMTILVATLLPNEPAVSYS